MSGSVSVESSVIPKIHQFVTESQEERKAFLRDLVRTDSTTGSEGPIQEQLRRYLLDQGFEVEVLPVDEEAVERLSPAGRGKPNIGGPNLLGTLRGSGGGRSLLLNGHCDTVPIGKTQLWSEDPLGGEIRDGEMWGRGTCDMKAGIAAIIFAMMAVQRAGIQLRGDVAFLSTVGEEEGSPGALSFAAGKPSYDAAIITEPTRLAVAPAHAGSAHVKVHFRGKGTHASVRDSGVSAIEKFCAFMATLPGFEAERNAGLVDSLYATVANKVPVSVGMVNGGHAAAAVPEELTCVVRVGVLPSEDFETVKTQFEDHVARWAAGDPWLAGNPPIVDWSGPQVAGSQIPADAPIVTSVAGVISELTATPVSVRGITGGTDMVHFVNAGIPTIIFGPGDVVDAHRADERVSLEEFDLATHILAETIVRWCGVS